MSLRPPGLFIQAYIFVFSIALPVKTVFEGGPGACTYNFLDRTVKEAQGPCPTRCGGKNAFLSTHVFWAITVA